MRQDVHVYQHSVADSVSITVILFVAYENSALGFKILYI